MKNTAVTQPETTTSNDVGEISKTPKLKTLVRITEFKGKTYVDARQFFMSEKNEWIATKKGISVRKDQLSEFITLLEKTEAHIKGA